MKHLLKFMSMSAIIACILISACKKEDTTETKTLYERLGGVDAISAVVDQFIVNVVGDPVINAQFAATAADPFRAQLLRNNLIDQICAGAGGPCQYKGKTMKDAHKGMGITDPQFTALVGDLVAALDKFSVPQQEKDDLLAILAPMKSDIVNQ